jgi:hypothetical protein
MSPPVFLLKAGEYSRGVRRIRFFRRFRAKKISEGEKTGLVFDVAIRIPNLFGYPGIFVQKCMDNS